MVGSEVENSEFNGTGQVLASHSLKELPGGTVVREEKLYADGVQTLTSVTPSVGGLPLVADEVIVNKSGERRHISRRFAYDNFGRVIKAKAYTDSGDSIQLAVNSYDATGRLGTVSYTHSLEKTMTYGVRGELKSWSMPNFGQTLNYGDESTNPDWAGRITAITTNFRINLFRPTANQIKSYLRVNTPLS